MKGLLCLAFLQGTLAATVTYNWSIDWVRAAPDGVSRSVVGINGKWPCPTMEANLGDTIVVNVYNNLGNETTGIHFHGQKQVGTSAMDGPSGIVQCSIPPGGSFVYNFTANPGGSFWYHSHNKGQYPDGLRGPLIIHDPSDPYTNANNGELTLTLSDWYWSQMPDLLLKYLSPENSEGVEPAPNSTLLNDSQNIEFPITAGKTYRLRIINMGNFLAQCFKIIGHELTITAVDSVPVQAQTVDSLYVSVGQRYDILFTAKASSSTNYFFVSSLDEEMVSGPFAITYPQAYGYLVYNSTAPLPDVYVPSFSIVDDTTLVPYDLEPLLGPVDTRITINMDFDVDGYNINRGTINGQSYVAPVVPTLYTVLSAPAEYVLNSTIYGTATNPFVVKYGQIVEIVINNLDTGSHPWHMHGHQFQVIYRGAQNGPTWDGTQAVPSTPVRRDVSLVNTNSSSVWRFKADNPGVFLIHCHIEWHVEAGLTATLIEAPDHIQGAQQIPGTHQDVCKSDGTSVTGNAAGNTNNWLNLTGEQTVPIQYDYGSLVGTNLGGKLRARSRIER